MGIYWSRPVRVNLGTIPGSRTITSLSLGQKHAVLTTDERAYGFVGVYSAVRLFTTHRLHVLRPWLCHHVSRVPVHLGRRRIRRAGLG